jgi:Flp pilus assembly pilin Flp
VVVALITALAMLSTRLNSVYSFIGDDSVVAEFNQYFIGLVLL